MKKAGKLVVLGMITMGVLSACGTKNEPNEATSKNVETSVRTAAPSYTPAKETPVTQVKEHPLQKKTKKCTFKVKSWNNLKDSIRIKYLQYGEDAKIYMVQGTIKRA